MQGAEFLFKNVSIILDEEERTLGTEERTGKEGSYSAQNCRQLILSALI